MTVIFALTSMLAAQDWSYYTNNDCIRALVSDSNFVYIGTESGLVILEKNSREFTVYNTVNSDLTCHEITSLAIFQNKLWVGTASGGLATFDGTNLEIYNRSNSGLPNDRINSLAVDTNKIWVGLSTAIVSFDGLNWTSYTKTNSELPGSVYSIAIDNDIVWIGTERGLASFDGTHWEIYNKDNSVLDHNLIESLVISNDTLWIGATYSGLYTYSDSGLNVYDNSFKFDVINTLEIHNNKIYVGTKYNGVRIFNSNGWKIYNTSNTNWLNQDVNAILVEDDILWVGTDYKLYALKDTTWEIINISSSGLPYNFINAITPYNHKIWVGTKYGLASFDGENWENYNSLNSNVPIDVVTALSYDDSLLLVGTRYGGLFSFNENIWTTHIDTQTFPVRITCICAYDDQIWCGTDVNGLLHLDSSGLTTYSTYNSSIPCNEIGELTLYHDTLWVGTGTGGLASFSNGTWTQYDEINDFSDFPTICITSLAEANDQLWIGLEEGLIISYDGTNWVLQDQDKSIFQFHTVSSMINYGSVLWTTNDYGLVSHNGSGWETYEYENTGLPNDVVRLATLDSNLWIGTNDGLIRHRLPTPTLTSTYKSTPGEFILSQNYPNPFNPTTTIEFNISTPQYVSLQIFDIAGRLVTTLVDGMKETGKWEIKWDASDHRSGLYVYRLKHDDKQISKKMLLIK